ncbi:MAG: type II secretion system protein GspD [Gemmatimonadaceae bacterium]
MKIAAACFARRLTCGALLLLGATALHAQDTLAVQVTPRGVLVDFQDADLRAVIMALSEAAGLNVSYGDLPARRVTLRLRQPVPRESIAGLLRSLAQSHGLQVQEEAGLLRFAAAEPQAPAPAAGQSAEARLFVYHLKHVQAGRLAATLQAIFGGGRPGDYDPRLRPSLSEQLRNQRIAPTTADTLRPRIDTAVVGLTSQLRGEVQIVPDEGTNALVVRAIPEDWTVIEQAIQLLDLRPLQVLIEVLIAEVRLTDDLQLGIGGTVRRAANGNTTTAELKGLTTADFVLNITRGGKFDLDAALSAMQTRGNVRVISRPLLLAQNNREARILVGSERPFVQVFRSLPTDVAVRDQIVQYRDVGTSLTILPTVNPDDYVNLQVAQEVSSATSEQQFGAPIISTREATTYLFVKSGATAVLGGLMDRQQERTRTGIPGLSALPILGALFGTTRVNNTTSELFLFLTPHVVRTDEQLEELRRRLSEQSSDKDAAKQFNSVLRDSTAKKKP